MSRGLGDVYKRQEESHEYGKIDINKIKGEYIKANITEDKIAILIDDDVRILNETKKF